MRILSTTMLSVALFALGTTPGYAAALSALNAGPIEFKPSASEAEIISKGAASITFGNTKIYVGYNQVTSINQDPIVVSFTNGVRNWVQSYDQSGVDARAVGLLWDEASQNLYAAFTADGGSNGANTFGNWTGNGWLNGYGNGGGPKASVLLKLNPATGNAEAGTYIRAQLNDGKTNTLVPTGLDYVNNQVVFFGDSYFAPPGLNGQPLGNQTPGTGSPFDYRVVLTPDLQTALSTEAINWEGVTAFSSLESGSPDPDDPDDTVETPDDPDDTAETPDDTAETPDDPDDTAETPDTDDDTDETAEDPIAEDIEETDTESIPEPSLVLGLGVVLSAGTWLHRGRQSRS